MVISKSTPILGVMHLMFRNDDITPMLQVGEREKKLVPWADASHNIANVGIKGNLA